MTVKMRGYAPRYIGLAADAMPTMDLNSTHVLPAGSEFYALDSHTNYLFDGVGTWYVAPLLTTSSG